MLKSKVFFSVVEMITVVFIILLLMSLLVPTYHNLKMDARTSKCRNHLRQIGTMITAYSSDHNGYLPYKWANGAYSEDNGLKGDIPKPPRVMYTKGPSNELYRNWNGHLLPYIDVHLPHQYTRYAMVTKVGTTRSDNNQLGGPPNPPPANPLDYGWAVVNEAFVNGGYNDLKVFICPEIHQNTFDVSASVDYNGVKVPRISQLCAQGFGDRAGFDYSMNGGTPTTYVANRFLFDNSIGNSLRLENIENISNKAFLLEGGIANPFGPGSNGAIASPYFDVGSPVYDGGDLSFYVLQSNRPSLHKLSFVHDNFYKFWIMPSNVGYGGYFPNMWWSRNIRIEVTAKFNAHFAPKAYMIEGTQTTHSFDGCGIVSFVDPEEYAPIFKKFFDQHFPGTIPLNPFVAYTDEPNDYHYLTGSTNVLFGDGSAIKKDQAWLFNNRRQITFNSN